MKLNMGCGFNKIEGYVNVDKYSTSNPDIVMDLEKFPWDFGTNEVDEVIFNHSLEHMGGTSEIFLGIFKELYRVCKHGATINITVPHPRHDTFLNDPTHVRAITPDMFSLFSKRENSFCKEHGYSNTPLALYLDVDFEIAELQYCAEHYYMEKVQSGEISNAEFERIAKERNNVIIETRISLKVIKEYQ